MSKERAFWAIYISVAISYMGVGLVAPLISIVLAEHGANSVMVGLVGTTMFTAFTLASFPLGAAVDRFGPKPILIIGLAVYGVSLLLFAFINSTGLFFVVRAIEGAGGAAISVATETMISQLSGAQERARRMSYYALSVGLGWAAGPLAGALLFKVQVGLPFYASCGFSLLAALAVLTFVPRTGGGGAHHVEGLAENFSTALLVPLSAGALYGYLMSSLVTLFPLHLKHLGVSETRMGSVITAVIIGTILSQIPLGKAADHFGKRKVLLVCALLVAGIFVAMAQGTNWQSFLVTGALLGAVAGSFYPIGLSIIGDVVSAKRLGAATSMFTLVFGIGSLIGPTVSGFAMSHFGDPWLFYLPAILTAVFCLEVIALYHRTKNRQRKKSIEPAANQ
ncbi:MAG: MFS transporter [Acidobacteria bacterium]|nr:MFS transporter [Acidobacteriota bacterium]